MNAAGCSIEARVNRWRWRVLLAVLALPFVIGLAIGLVTAWRAMAIVRPPRIPVDTLEVQRSLPGAQDVAFAGVDGALLSGTYVAPRNGAAVVLVHGLFANRMELLPEAMLLAQEGYGVLLYDNRAHGNSGGPVATWGQLESADASRAVDYVVDRTGLPRAKIGLLGLSIGGTAVLREATDDLRIGGVVVEATYSSMGAEVAYMFGRWGPLSQLPALWVGEFVGGMNYDLLVPRNLVCGLGPRPLLLVYGSKDADVPLTEGIRMSDAACRPEALYIVDTKLHGHYMEVDDGGAYSQRLLQFFGSALLA